MHLADLDEFGHLRRYVHRSHSKHRRSPVFCLASFMLPAAEVRGLGSSNLGAVVRAGEVAEDSDRSFGEMLALAEPDPRMAQDGISVVDLTGIGVQDLAIAMLTLRELTP